MPYLKSSTAPQTDIYFEDSGGSGQPVVLIHGWPLSHAMWEGQVNVLTAAGYRCVSYDRRGFGESGKATGGYDYDTFAADLRDLMEELDLRNAVLAGFSMGGGEVVRYLSRYGAARVSKAMLIAAVPPFLLKTRDNPDGVNGSVFDGMLDGVKKDRVAFLESFVPMFFNDKPKKRTVSDDVIAYNKSIAWPASPLGTQQCIVAFGETDFRPDLAKITVPLLVVHGDKDQIVPIDVSGKRSAKMVKGSRLEVIKGAPHGLNVTHADALNKLMLDFLGGR